MSLEALLTTAAFAPLHDVGWLRVTGEDRVRWLNGMTTNNIAALIPGQGCYTFFLNAQGRILADATAFLLEDAILLETTSPGDLATLLDHFIIMDDVELEVTDSGSFDEARFRRSFPQSPPRPVGRQGLLLAGPQSPAILSSLSLALPSDAALTQTIWNSFPLTVVRAYSPLVPCYEFWCTLRDSVDLVSAFRRAGAAESTSAAFDDLRILSGIPYYGTDIRNTEARKDLPQETAQTRALHFSKGCYLGQEIVERIHSRGAVHRTFTGFLLTPDTAVGIPDLDGMIVNAGISAPPAAGTALFLPDAPGKPVGELTSVAATPFGLVALGYLRREILDAGKSIQYPGGTATPSALPFPIDTMKRA